MIIYHGSDIKVTKPKIIITDKGRDFGPAFYLTPIKEQAERMAKRKTKLNKSKHSIISVFEWDEKASLKLKFNKIKDADLEWLDMITSCRTNPSFKHGFDIVEGKIADDSVGETILFVIDGVIKKKMRLIDLNSKKLTHK